MKILITGICGFVGSNLAKSLLNNLENTEIFGIDNLFRKGSESNFQKLAKLKIHIVRGDIRNSSDLSALPRVDWVIDCAANPSVLAATFRKQCFLNHQPSRILQISQIRIHSHKH